MSEAPQIIESPHVVQIGEPQSIQSDFIGIIQDEIEELSVNFHDTLAYLDKLIELENIDFENNEAEFVAKAEELNTVHDHKKTSISLLKISKCEADFEEKYLDQLKQLHTITKESFKAYSKNFDILYEEGAKNNELNQLEKSLVKIAPIELDSEEGFEYNIDFSEALDKTTVKEVNEEENDEHKKESDEDEDVDMDRPPITETDKLNIELFQNKDFSKLSEADIYRILRIEKIKRAKLSFKNENVFKPEIEGLKKEFDKWVTYDNQLKRFFDRDIPEMNKRVQTIKKKENL